MDSFQTWQDARTLAYAYFFGEATMIARLIEIGAMDATQAATAIRAAEQRLTKKFEAADIEFERAS